MQTFAMIVVWIAIGLTVIEIIGKLFGGNQDNNQDQGNNSDNNTNQTE